MKADMKNEEIFEYLKEYIAKPIEQVTLFNDEHDLVNEKINVE